MRLTDLKVECSSTNVNIKFFEPNTNCDENKLLGQIAGTWDEGNTNCLQTKTTSFKLVRDDDRTLLYYRSAYEAEKWLEQNNFRS